MEGAAEEVLIVENSDIVQGLMRGIFGFTQYKAIAAYHGKSALALINAKQGLYRMVFLDLLMPVMGGVQTIQAIRKLPNEKAATPVVALTGNNEEYSKEAFRSFGFNAVIIKPVDSAQFLKVFELIPERIDNHWVGFINHARSSSRVMDA